MRRASRRGRRRAGLRGPPARDFRRDRVGLRGRRTGHPRLRGEFPHEGRVGARFFAAQSVVQMENGQRKIPLAGEFRQKVQQAHGIGAAGDRYANAGAAREHVITSDDFGDPLEHSSIVASPFNSL